jgi:hypothetical protein
MGISQHMKIASNTLLGLSMAAGALIAAVGLNVQAGDVGVHVHASPAYLSPEPAPPPPSPSPAPPVVQYDPNQDYWTGQAGGGGAPGAGGGG